MKKSTIIAVAAVLILGLATFGHAKYVSGFKIVEVAEKQVTIQKGDEDPVVVQVKKDGYKVGEKVKFDAQRMKIKQAPKQPLEGC